MVKWRWILLVLVFLVVDFFALRWWLHWRREQKVQGFILASAQRYGVEPALVRAVVWRESRFRPDVRGEAGELGLMQIRAAAAQEWASAEKIRNFSHDQVLHPRTNTLAGTWYLAKLLARYRATTDPAVYALADYNAGRTHVLRWNDGAAETNAALFLQQMTYPGTRRYIEAVLAQRDRYR